MSPRDDPTDAQVHSRITRAILADGRRTGWGTVDPYSRQALPRHARLAGAAETLLDDPVYVLAADPDAMLNALPPSAPPPLGARVRAYRRAAHLLRSRSPAERAVGLQLAGLAAGELAFPAPSMWPVRWRRGPSVTSLLTLVSHGGSVDAVATAILDGTVIVVTGSADGTARIWDLTSGQPIGDPLAGHTDAVTAVATGVVNDTAIVVTGSADGTARIWDLTSGQPIGDPLTGHTDAVTAVATGTVNDTPVVVTGSMDRTVRIWDAATGRLEQMTGRLFQELRRWLWQELSHRRSADERRHDLPIGHTFEVSSVAIGVVSGLPAIVTGSRDHTVRVWDAKTARPRAKLESSDAIVSVAISSIDDRSVIVGAGQAGAQLWDAETLDLRQAIEFVSQPDTEGRADRHSGSVTSMTVGVMQDSSTVLVTTSVDDTVRLWDPISGEQLGSPLTGHTNTVAAVATGSIERTRVIVTGSYDGTVRVWQAQPTTIENAESTIGHTRRVNAIAVSTIDGRQCVVTGSADRTVRIWDAETGQLFHQLLTGFESAVDAVAFAVVDRTPVVVTGSWLTVSIWNATTGDLIRSLPERLTSVTSIAIGFIADTPVVVTGGAERAVQVWDATNGRLRRRLEYDAGWQRLKRAARRWDDTVWAVAFGIVDRAPVVAAGNDNACAYMWDAVSGRLLHVLDGHTDAVTTVAIGAIKNRASIIVTGSPDMTARIWDAVTGRVMEVLDGHSDAVTAVSVGTVNNRTVIVTGSSDETVRIWDAVTGRLIITLPTFGTVSSVAITENGQIAVATRSEVIVFDGSAQPGDHRSESQPVSQPPGRSRS